MGPEILATGDTRLDTFQIVPHLRDLGVAYALSFLIGWDRERGERSAGLRTFPLVAIASCGFIQATEGLLQHSPEGSARIVDGLHRDRLHRRRRNRQERQQRAGYGDSRQPITTVAR